LTAAQLHFLPANSQLSSSHFQNAGLPYCLILFPNFGQWKTENRKYLSGAIFRKGWMWQFCME
jgi:hypothetical protein